MSPLPGNLLAGEEHLSLNPYSCSLSNRRMTLDI